MKIWLDDIRSAPEDWICGKMENWLFSRTEKYCAAMESIKGEKDG